MKKILIVSSTFYPDKTVGAIRVSQWAKHLPTFGWQPIVACRFQGVEATSEEIANDIGSGCTIHYLDYKKQSTTNSNPTPPKARKSLLHFAKHQIAKKLIEPFSVPDVSKWTWQKLEQRLLEIASQEKPDVILSSSPPHSLHGVAMKVANQLGVPLICDFRDPFLNDSRFRPTGIRKILSHKFVAYEQRLVEQSAQIITAIPAHFDELTSKYPDHQKIHLIKNGYPDEMTFESKRTRPEHDIVITTAGVISNECTDVFRQVFQILEKEFDHRHRFLFHHFGPKPESAVEDTQFKFHGKVSHERVLKELVTSDFLLLFINEIRSRCSGLSSKLFEYLATGLPIIAIRPTSSDQQLLESLEWVSTHQQPVPAQVAEFIKTAIQNQISAPQPWLKQYRLENGRKNRAEQLSEILSSKKPKNLVQQNTD